MESPSNLIVDGKRLIGLTNMSCLSRESIKRINNESTELERK